MMRFASASSEATDSLVAARAMAISAAGQLEGPADFALVFFTPTHSATATELVATIADILETDQIIGCSAGGVFGPMHEIEEGPAASLLAARMPGGEIHSFGLDGSNWRERLEAPQVFQESIGLAEAGLLILLADPFSTPTTPLLECLGTIWPGMPVVGGLASGADAAGGNVLVLGRDARHQGAVGLAIGGAVEIDIIVSQGCRPVGPVMEVTAASRNLILGLDGRPPLERLQSLLRSLPILQREQIARGLFIGRAARSAAEGLGRGDFLIRNLIGFDQESGILAVADLVQEQESVQFHLRDAKTATEDLAMLLAPQVWQAPAAGALAFGCNGRGSRFFGRPDGDLESIHRQLGKLPLAGCFCAGEIGPIAGRNYVHGHTLSLALFRPKGPSEGPSEGPPEGRSEG
jgi:small ligand-binding sensory domain FIST